jgi:hypothetical protein
VENQDLPSEQENTPKSSGLGKYKLLIALIVCGLIALGFVATRSSGLTSSGGSSVVDAAITLITSDRNDVDCVSDTAIDGMRCAFITPEKPAQVDEKNKLQPFFTVDRRLFLIPGLFLDPAIELRFKSEPPTKPREQLTRFVARCKLRIQNSVTNIRVRWTARDNFGDPQPAEIATVVECKIEG